MQGISSILFSFDFGLKHHEAQPEKASENICVFIYQEKEEKGVIKCEGGIE